MNDDGFRRLCGDLRRDIVEMFIAADGGHLPAALSVVEILATLFFGEMKLASLGYGDAERDRFIFSKGHGCLALYAALGRLGLLKPDELARVGRMGSELGWHPTAGKVPGIEVSSGSLGLGPSVAVGSALAQRQRRLSSRTFCVLGDGECGEGSVWEAAMSAAHKRLGRLFFIIDCNGHQANGPTKDVCDLEPFADKWRAFGWQTYDIDLKEQPRALAHLLAGLETEATAKPTAIICRTAKGSGIPFLEGNPAWHSKTKLGDDDRRLLRESVAR